MGKKRLKNVPILYEGIKKKRAIGLTDTAYQNLQEAAAAEKLCLSEFVETWARQLKLQRIHESALKEGFQRQVLQRGEPAQRTGSPRPHWLLRRCLASPHLEGVGFLLSLL
ncbi:hypothetical protein BZZ01_21215 [Nostocales cyanobacterium HT-58-2]|nr:hypothetical protein BZZ01_21215 [Nostocales cyanobacterium HT-58-2]